MRSNTNSRLNSIFWILASPFVGLAKVFLFILLAAASVLGVMELLGLGLLDIQAWLSGVPE